MPNPLVTSCEQRELLMPAFLTVVFLTVDLLRCLVLGGVDAGPFLFRHDSIGLGFILHRVDMLLLVLEPARFPLGELAARNTLVDALFLVRLPLIDPRRLSLSIGHSGRQ